MTKLNVARAGLLTLASIVGLSTAMAAPRISAPDRSGFSPIVRTASDDESASPRNHEGQEFHSGQRMHSGGGGNSK